MLQTNGQKDKQAGQGEWTDSEKCKQQCKQIQCRFQKVAHDLSLETFGERWLSSEETDKSSSRNGLQNRFGW